MSDDAPVDASPEAVEDAYTAVVDASSAMDLALFHVDADGMDAEEKVREARAKLLEAADLLTEGEP